METSDRHMRLKVVLLGDTETVAHINQLIATFLKQELSLRETPYETKLGLKGTRSEFITSLQP